MNEKLALLFCLCSLRRLEIVQTLKDFLKNEVNINTLHSATTKVRFGKIGKYGGFVSRIRIYFIARAKR